ncbi:hypothetical protein [Cryptosporangium arvum]|uniref:hypothetical protein n=1 Tax=Cryptosporangium arvum TaxID=80871 RepID=UPI0004B105A9|nr:hypothetical protein [Cryptosporangium arvum]
MGTAAGVGAALDSDADSDAVFDSAAGDALEPDAGSVAGVALDSAGGAGVVAGDSAGVVDSAGVGAEGAEGAVAAGVMAAAITAGVTAGGAGVCSGWSDVLGVSELPADAVASADSSTGASADGVSAGETGADRTSPDSVVDDSAGVPAGVAAVLSLPEVSMTILVPVPVAGIFTTASAAPPCVSRMRPSVGRRPVLGLPDEHCHRFRRTTSHRCGDR